MSHHHAITAGIDLGDRYSHLCLLDTDSGEILEESRIPTTQKAFERRFSASQTMRVAIETGTHSPWVSRLLKGFGHEVLVANARKVRLIYAQGRKTDVIDARKLARLARLDPQLLSPIEHRGEGSQAHLTLLRSRDALVWAPGQSWLTTSGERSRLSGLACLSAQRRAFTRRLPSTYRKSSCRPWGRSWRPSPR